MKCKFGIKHLSGVPLRVIFMNNIMRFPMNNSKFYQLKFISGQFIRWNNFQFYF